MQMTFRVGSLQMPLHFLQHLLSDPMSSSSSFLLKIPASAVLVIPLLGYSVALTVKQQVSYHSLILQISIT